MGGRFWLWFFFKAIEVRHWERVPPAGPVLLCINHPNNLIDSLPGGAVLPRQVHSLATAAIFQNPLMARFLRACGVIPVYRREDEPDRGSPPGSDARGSCVRGWELALDAFGRVGVKGRGRPVFCGLKTGEGHIRLWKRREGPS